MARGEVTRAMVDGRRLRTVSVVLGALLVVVLFLIGALVSAVPTGAVAKTTTTTEPKPIMDVSYGPASLENMNIYPAAAPDAPLVVLVHGGGWVAESATNYAVAAVAMQADGFAVFNINYRLASQTVSAFPMETYDVWLATHWAIAHAATYNADPTEVTLVGGSAGGELVAWVAEILPRGTLRAVVTLSGAFSFSDLINDIPPGNANYELAVAGTEALGCTLKTCTAKVEAAWSPADHVTRTNCPPAWLLVNSQDELMPLDQPTAMVSALRSKDCSVTEQILPGDLHAIGYWKTIRPTVVSFIRAHD